MLFNKSSKFIFIIYLFTAVLPAYAVFDHFQTVRSFYEINENRDRIVKGNFNESNDHLDIAVISTENQDMTIFLENGEGTFAQGNSYSIDHPIAVAIGNFGSGHQDLALVNHDLSEITLFSGNGDGTFNTPIILHADQFSSFNSTITESLATNLAIENTENSHVQNLTFHILDPAAVNQQLASLTHVASNFATGLAKFIAENNLSRMISLDNQLVRLKTALPTSAESFLSLVADSTALPSSPRHLRGFQVANRFVSQTNFVNVLEWKKPLTGPSPVAYYIYRDQFPDHPIATVCAPCTRFDDHCFQRGKTYTYYVVSVNADGEISDPVSVTLHPVK